MPPSRKASPAKKSAGPAKKSATKKAAARTISAKKGAKAVAQTATGRRRGPRGLTDEHKAQLARGREEARIVRAYLGAIDSGAKRPGRRRTPESITRQISQIDERLRDARGIEKLHLVKQRRELVAARTQLVPAADVSSLERDFIKVARRYGERRGIDYTIWREVGVPPTVLVKARVPRTRASNGRALPRLGK